MKCEIIVAIIACALSGSFASKVDKAHAEVMSYVADNMGGVRMMRSNRVHLECYNGFLPMINSIAQKAKDDSNICVQDADSKKDQALSGLDRTDIAAEVKKITESLADCSNQKGLEYFVCLEFNAEVNRQLLETIKNKAQKVISDNKALVGTIEGDELTCIMNAVDNAKNKSDSAFGKLKSCISGESTLENDEEEENSA